MVQMPFAENITNFGYSKIANFYSVNRFLTLLIKKVKLLITSENKVYIIGSLVINSKSEQVATRDAKCGEKMLQS